MRSIPLLGFLSAILALAAPSLAADNSQPAGRFDDRIHLETIPDGPRLETVP